MAGYTLLICIVLSLLPNCEGSSNGVISKSLKEVPEMRGRESTIAVLATYTGTTSTAECGVRCLKNSMCWSLFMNKPLQQCRLNHRVLAPDMTNSELGWKYYEFSSSENKDIPANSGISTSTPADTGISTSTPAESGISTSTPADSGISTSTPADTGISTSTPADSGISTSTPADTGISTSTPADSGISTSTPADTAISTSTPADTGISTSTPADTGISTSTPADTGISTSTPADTGISTSTPADTGISTSTPADTGISTSTPADSGISTSTPAESGISIFTPANSGISTSSPANCGIATSTPADASISASTPADSDPPETTSSPEPCTRGSYCCREGLCLKLFPDKLYWQDASEKCFSLGERLLVIDSHRKQQLVVQMVQEMGGDDDIEIGGKRIDSDWVWQDGRAITEFYWGPENPQSGKNYLKLEVNYDFSWRSTTGATRPHDYICEKY